MATSSIVIHISPEDLKILKSQGYSLYGFKAVEASGNGSPTVWFNLSSSELLTTTSIVWEDEFQAYDSTTPVIPNITIQPSNVIDAELAELITIQTGSYDIVSDGGGNEAAITFLNENSQQLTVGINQTVNGHPNMLCAFPISGNGRTSVIVPVPKIALIFSSQYLNPGVVVTKAMGSGALIDLTGVDSREITFDLNTGWSADEAFWLTNFNANTNLQSLLIESINSEERVPSEEQISQ